MPLTLILTRHAKSEWGDPTRPDRERTLNPRGRRDAPRIGSWLAKRGVVPDLALVSSARRTQETWSLLGKAFPAKIETRFLDRLYHAEPSVILDAIKTADRATVMVVGHNPGIGEAAQRLLRDVPDNDRFHTYPTCATLVCTFEAHAWADITWESGTEAAFVTPHDI